MTQITYDTDYLWHRLPMTTYRQLCPPGHRFTSCCTALTCIFLTLLAMTILIGMRRTIIASPASTEGPRISQSSASETIICSGADHSMFIYVMQSIKRWASTDIRFTISPVVDSLRDADVNLSDWNSGELCYGTLDCVANNWVEWNRMAGRVLTGYDSWRQSQLFSVLVTMKYSHNKETV